MRCPPRIWLKIARIVKYFLQISGDFVTNLVKIHFLYKPTGVFTEIELSFLMSELQMFRRSRNIQTVKQAVSELRMMLPEVRAQYPEICTLVRLLIVSPASSTEAERSFSALRRLKTWLRTTMTEMRLNSVTVSQTHRERLDALDITPLLRDFASRSELRRRIFGKFD